MDEATRNPPATEKIAGTRSRVEGDRRSEANKVRQHGSRSSFDRPASISEDASVSSDRSGAPWPRFVWSCRESPDPAGRRRVKRSADLRPKGLRGQQHADEAT